MPEEQRREQVGVTTQRDLQEDMLKTLRQIEVILLSGQVSKPEPPPLDPDLVAAEVIAAWIERNTAQLSEITLVPDSEPKNPEEVHG